jgi:hypothetical protein
MIQKDLASSTIFLTTRIIGFYAKFKSFAFVSTGHKDKGKKTHKKYRSYQGRGTGR